MNRNQKEAMVEGLRAKLENAAAMIVAEYPGTSVSSFTSFRKRAREANVYVRVIKNRLAKIALKDTQYETISDKLQGPIIYGISEDSVAVSKLFRDFSKETSSIKITGGAIPGKVLSVDEVNTLASIPSRDELLAKLIGTMQAPVIQFVRILNEIPSKFVRTLAAVRDAKTS